MPLKINTITAFISDDDEGAQTTGRSIKIVKFSVREELEVLTPDET